MKLEVNIEKKHAYIIIGLLVVLIGVLIVGARTWGGGNVPDPGHDADQILVWFEGKGTKTLQQAIGDGDFTGAAANVEIGECIWLSYKGKNIAPSDCQHCGSWYTNKDAKCPVDYPLMTTIAFDVLKDETNDFRITCCQLLVNGKAVSYTPAF